MTHEEITGKIKFDLREFKNEHGFFDVPMKWPFNNGIPEEVVQKILIASDKIRAIDDAFSELLEEYFFSDDFSPTKEEIIVDKFLSVETSELIRVNNYNLRDFIANWVNFKVDDRVFREQLSQFEPIKQSLEEMIKFAARNNQYQKDNTKIKAGQERK